MMIKKKIWSQLRGKLGDDLVDRADSRLGGQIWNKPRNELRYELANQVYLRLAYRLKIELKDE